MASSVPFVLDSCLRLTYPSVVVTVLESPVYDAVKQCSIISYQIKSVAAVSLRLLQLRTRRASNRRQKLCPLTSVVFASVFEVSTPENTVDSLVDVFL